MKDEESNPETTALMHRLGRIVSKTGIQPDAEPVCPALKADEWRCVGNGHLIRAVDGELPPDPRDCPLQRYVSERNRLADALALCGYGLQRDAMTDPVGPALLNGISPQRDAAQLGARDGVQDLRAALKKVRQIRDAGAAAAPHVHAVGSTGTAKTMVLLGLYFSWLWEGARVFWITNRDLATAARQRISFDEEIQNRGRDWLLFVRKWPILFLSDLGAQLFDPRLRGDGNAGASAQAALMLDLLDSYSGRLLWDSNLDSQQLREHADFGPRVVSRLMADRQGAAIELISLYGADQRQHELTKRLRGKQAAA